MYFVSVLFLSCDFRVTVAFYNEVSIRSGIHLCREGEWKVKRKLILMGVAGVLAMTAIIGGTLAGFNTQSEQGKTDITTRSLGIELTGKSVRMDEEKLVTDTYMPGTEVNLPYYVTNNVEEGYDLYTRVTIDKYWEQKENGELDPAKIRLYTRNADGTLTELTAGDGAEAVRTNDWFVQYADEEQVILYYARPLAAGEQTGNVLDCLVVDAEAGNEYTNQRIVLEVRADAVQKIAAESSIPSEWGVYPEFDTDGNIVSIAE